MATNLAAAASSQPEISSGMCSATRGSDMWSAISASAISDKRTNAISTPKMASSAVDARTRMSCKADFRACAGHGFEEWL